MNQVAWERAQGMRGYRGSPAELEDRQEGIKVGGRCLWQVDPEPMTATITRIDIDDDGEPWFHLTFEDDHKDVRVERGAIAPLSLRPALRP